MIFALLVVVLLPLVPLLLSGVAKWTAQIRGERHAQEREWAQFRCIEGTIMDRVPEGASVVVIAPEVLTRDPRSGARVRIEDPYWKQRLTELAYPWAEVVDRRSKAQYVLSVGNGAQCEGVRLEVKRA